VRVFLDTNVLASAAATRGLCADVVREVLTSHELLTSEQVLRELERVLKDKFGVAQDLIGNFISLMRQDTVIVEPGALPPVEIKDQNDLPILSAAISGGTDLFVTGDKEILKLVRIDKMMIVSPRQFWEKLKARARQRAGRAKPRRPR
jgi:uncharacterized protein